MQKYFMNKMLTNAFQHNLTRCGIYTPKTSPESKMSLFQQVIEQNPYNLVSQSMIQYWITLDFITLL